MMFLVNINPLSAHASSIGNDDDRVVTSDNVKSSLVNTYYYVDWKTANPSAGTASGTITLPGGVVIDVEFKVLNPSATPGTFYGYKIGATADSSLHIPSNFDWSLAWYGGENTNGSAYTSPEVSNYPTPHEALALVGGTKSSYIITFSQNGQPLDVRDPAMAIASLGAGTDLDKQARYDFDRPFDLVSHGRGWWSPWDAGSASDITRMEVTGQSLIGKEGHGTIRFVGSFDTFSWTAPWSEIWHQFTIGIRGLPDLDWDEDGDEIPDVEDNCPTDFNPFQEDTLDGDGTGDACDLIDDSNVDTDGDGWSNSTEHAKGTSPTNPDTDGDGIKDSLDNFPVVANSDQADSNNDGVGDACSNVPDPDYDGDGVNDDVDNCPLVANADQADTDGDGIGDACDPDADGDSVPNAVDFCPSTGTIDNVGWGQNRWRFDFDANAFLQNALKGKSTSGGSDRGNNTTYTMESTGGCSCEQIIVALNLGDGHKKHGCSNSAMSDWAAIVAGVAGKGATNAFDSDESNIPMEVTLQGNYPNPFNPQTTISFALPEAAQVSLVVYDLMGREVRVLVRGTVSAGTHEASFDASNLPSGAYIYRLSTPKGEFTKMMTLMK